MARKIKTIYVRITEKNYNEWHEFIEKMDLDSVSMLVRVSIADYIKNAQKSKSNDLEGVKK